METIIKCKTCQNIFIFIAFYKFYATVIKEFVEMWKARDNPEIIKMDNRFSDSCEKWGFN